VNEKLTIITIATFAFLIGVNSVSSAMAIPAVNSNPEHMTTYDCADLIADLQVLVENRIISSSDVRDVLPIFFCINFGMF